ncbi:MAG: methylated-DNA--[protein]-cysteine S-methyltransferase [Dehalococcoidia bacterium]
MRFCTVETALGWLGLVLGPDGLRAVTLPRRHKDEALSQVLALGARQGARADELGDLPDRFRRYARGERIAFPDRLDFAGATAFQRAVWQATREIPYGQRRSYGWLAARVGRPRAARAVGQAMAANPWPIIVPCHRVVSSNGRLTGFGGGLDMKERLLLLEGAIDG